MSPAADPETPRAPAALGGRLLRAGLSFLIAVALVWALLAWSDVHPREVVDTVARMPLGAFALALAIHCAIYALRAWRFRVLIPSAPPPTLWQACVIGAAHNLATYLLPAKTGEGAWVVYLKTRLGVPSSVGLASLVVARLLDLAVLCGELGIVCVVLAFGADAAKLRWLAPVGALLLALTIVFFVLASNSHWLTALAHALLRGSGLSRTGLGARLGTRLDSIAAALVEAAAGGRLWRAALLTVPQWLGIFAFYAVLARAMGLDADVGFVEACFGSSLAVLTNLLPINGFAGFGTQEGGWVLGFGVLGVPRDAALSTALGVHVVQLFDTLALGLVALALMAWLWPPRRDVR
ncbi:MAG: flippase-like domain-containing protein [Planctomycetota bacterium]|nr:MAG: flippase-like domain-containing protein [Planctomycetota bacterium]